MAVVFFAGLIFVYLIPGFEKAMMERKRIMIHEITTSAYSLLNHYHSLELAGVLEKEEAQEQARTAISSIRYGETLKDYFWITDLHPRMIDHPYRPDLNGQDLTGFRDSNGKPVFVEFVKAVSLKGESYVDYMWQWNDDSTRVMPKLSYVRLYEPWGWIIGTGIYIDDVRAEIGKMELRALIISGIIGLIIIMLLAAVSQQSHKIEKRRSETEKELRKSKELYRTLAEAASEGVLIWSGQLLQANKTLLSWLEFTEEELQKTNFHQILMSPEISEFNDSDTLYDELGTRRYVECVLNMKNGNPVRSHADFSRIMLGQMKAVLVVLRPAGKSTSPTAFSPHSASLNNIDTGFFRMAVGRKTRFLHATQPALDLMGFNNMQELVSHNPESLFVYPAQLKAIKSVLVSERNVSGRVVHLRRKNGEEFTALLNVVFVESNLQEVLCDGSIEMLAASSSHHNSPTVGLQTYGTSYLMETPVTAIMKPPVECNENLPVSRVVAVMKENNTRFVTVINKKGDPLGIIEAGVICLKLSEGGSSETEIFRWMSSPPDLISEDTKINKAFVIIQESLTKCLLVTSEKKGTVGFITNDELSKAISAPPELIFSEIAKAGTASSLRSLYLKNRRTAVSMILGHADPYAVSLYLSTVADAICQRILDLCLDEAGVPPCQFAFIQTGSAGRREQTLSTDQDNAIIFENSEPENHENRQLWFVTLGKKVNEMLAEVGFRLCKGENMAGNPIWCQPVDMWKKYFTDWIKIPGPEELLEVSIFFDFRHCFGDQSLTDELHSFVKSGLKTNDIFFHHMAAAWKPLNLPSGHISDAGTDIKKILMPLTGIIRLYALKFGIDGFSTIERIVELYTGRKIDYRLLRETIRAWKDLTSLRLSHQAECINSETEPDNIVDFQLSDSELRFLAEQSVAAINNLILKSGSDFYTVTI